MTHFCNDSEYFSRASVEDSYPFAAHIVSVESGWLVFDTYTDYDIWCQQV